MTATWDEIWNKPAFNFLSYSPDEAHPQIVPDILSVKSSWLHEVKAEGDKLKENAEKWETLKSAIIEVSEDGKEWKTLNVMIMIETEKKLKAIMNFKDELENDYAFVTTSKGAYVTRKLKEILEGKG